MRFRMRKHRFEWVPGAVCVKFGRLTEHECAPEPRLVERFVAMRDNSEGLCHSVFFVGTRKPLWRRFHRYDRTTARANRKPTSLRIAHCACESKRPRDKHKISQRVRVFCRNTKFSSVDSRVEMSFRGRDFPRRPVDGSADNHGWHTSLTTGKKI